MSTKRRDRKKPAAKVAPGIMQAKAKLQQEAMKLDVEIPPILTAEDAKARINKTLDLGLLDPQTPNADAPAVNQAPAVEHDERRYPPSMLGGAYFGEAAGAEPRKYDRRTGRTSEPMIGEQVFDIRVERATDNAQTVYRGLTHLQVSDTLQRLHDTFPADLVRVDVTRRRTYEV